MFGGAVARSVSVTTCIHAGLYEFHLAVPGFEDEKLAAAPEMGGKVDSIVRWYSDLHVRVSLADTDSIAAFGLYMQVASIDCPIPPASRPSAGGRSGPARFP
jgi:hypothetical protein